MRNLEATDSNLCTVTVGLALYGIKKGELQKVKWGSRGHVLERVGTKAAVFQRDYNFSLAQKLPTFMQASD